MSDHARATVVNIFTLALLKRLAAVSTRVRRFQKCILVVLKVGMAEIFNLFFFLCTNLSVFRSYSYPCLPFSPDAKYMIA